MVSHSCSNLILMLQVLLKLDCSLWGLVHDEVRLFIMVRACCAMGFHGRLHRIGIDF